MDFALLAPEINSGRMYAGAGAGSMWTAATAWDGLGAELSSAAASYRSVVSGLTRGPWLGPASASMLAAAVPYVAWLGTTAEQAKQVANQARSAAAAYETAYAATVPPAVVTQNRELLMSLVATNLLGQNSPAIAATETQYAEMWAQDATAMYGYAGTSAAASTLTPFTAPPQDTNPAGVDAQAGAVDQAVGTSTATNTPAVLSQFVSAVPNALEELAAGGDSSGTFADWLNFTSGWTFIASGILFILGPLLTGPIAGALPTTSLGFFGAGLASTGAAALVSDATPGGAATISPSRTGVLAGLGRAASVGGLAVPPSWAGTAPALTRAATALPEPILAALPEAEVDGLGPGGGGMLPGSLMAAAAGGGGAAGGGWAATRGGGQRGGPAQPGGLAQPGGGGAAPGGGTRTRYGPPPAVIPQVAREAAPRAGANGRADLRGHDGDGPSNETLRDEINDLRNQIAELAMERDVLMRSLALWARGSTGQ